jgi:hypothetical protein
MQVWTLSRAVGVHSYFLQCIISLFVEFWLAVNMWSNERVLIVIEDLQRVRVFEMCIV